MAVRLEPALPAKVLVHVDELHVAVPFPFISRACHEAMRAVTTNPLVVSSWARSTLDLFTNITTMVSVGVVALRGLTRLAPSLVECRVLLASDVDLTPLTCLTLLEVSLGSRVSVTFPTQLKQLAVVKRNLGTSNVGDVVLKSFKCCEREHPIAQRTLKTLPTTLQTVEGEFSPASPSWPASRSPCGKALSDRAES